MDLQMAPVDGIQATREIRARYHDVEVVALTSFGEEERVHAALQAGASGYLLKDSDADEVVAAIRAAHRGELQIDPAVARGLMSSLGAAPQRRPDRGSDRPRARGAAARGRREGQQGDRRGAGDKRANGADTRVEHPRQARPHLTHAGSALGGSRRAGGSPRAERRGSARPAGGGARLPQDGGSRPCRTRSAARMLSGVESAFALKPPDFDAGTDGPAVSVLAGGAHRADARLLPPPRPAGLVPRPRAVRRLLEARELPVALLVAPAGYGKTTVLSEWAERDARPFAWVRLDADDRHPARLLASIAGALEVSEPVGKGVLTSLSSRRPDAIRRALSRLLRYLAYREQPVVLVLDDFHVLQGPEALDARTGARRRHAARIAARAGVTPRARTRRREPARASEGGGAAGRRARDVADGGGRPARRGRAAPRPAELTRWSAAPRGGPPGSTSPPSPCGTSATFARRCRGSAAPIASSRSTCETSSWRRSGPRRPPS